MNLHKRIFESPVGPLTLVCDDEALVAVLWPKEKTGRVRLGAMVEGSHPILKTTEKQLKEYFGGKRRDFDLPLKMHGTDFQKKVWRALQRIPFGETRSYTDIARLVGSAGAVRAVGSANGRNPLSIVVPCHRVIGANGALSGFAGGLEIKRSLLDLERED